MTPTTNETTKRVPKAKVAVDETAGTLTFTFATDPITEKVVAVAGLPQGITNRAVFHGLEQKLRDSYAGADSAAEAIEYFDATLANLVAGDWNKRGEPGERAEPLNVEIFTVLMSKIGREIDAETVKAKLAQAKEKGTLANLKKTPEWVAAENEVRASRAKSDTNAVAIIDAL